MKTFGLILLTLLLLPFASVFAVAIGLSMVAVALWDAACDLFKPDL